MTHLRERTVPNSRLGRLLMAAVLGGLLALVFVAPAMAQEATATSSPVGGSVSGYGVTDWMNLFLRLALVLVVIWFAIVAMRWWVRRMNGAVGNAGGHLEVVETRSLGPNRSLQLVKLGNRAVLLGVTAEQTSSVLEIDDPVEVERLATPRVADDSPTSFRDAVSRLGSLTSWRPVIERKRSKPAAAPSARAATTPSRFAAPTPPVAAAPRSRWMTLARRVIGLEDRPLPRTVAAGRAPAAALAARRPAAPAAAAAPMAPAGRAPRSLASARATASELPVSRAARASSGYRQNQIAEAQRAIASVRAGMNR